MDLNKLDRVVAIYEAGSFRKAAGRLGITQPALTLSIRLLEEELNTRLFERGPRGIRPTPPCDRLVRRARLILRHRERILGDVEESARDQTIDLGVHPILLTGAFAQCIAAFTDEWPSTTVRVREGYSSDLHERLARGELDLACCALPQAQDHGGALAGEALALLNYSVIADAEHPVFSDHVSAQRVAPYRWADFDTAVMGAFPGDVDIMAILAKAGRDSARKNVRTASMNVIKLLVASGGFIGLIADQLVADELASGRLRRVPGTSITASPFGFASLKDDFATSAVAALREMLARTAFEPLRRSSPDQDAGHG